MRLIIIMVCLLLLLFTPVFAAPAPPPPWDAPDRELISSFPGQKYYFIASSVQMYPEAQGFVVDTVREFDSIGDGSLAKYVTETYQIIPHMGWIRALSIKGYDAKGNLLYNLPVANWQTPDNDVHGRLLPVIVDYIRKNQASLIVESRPTDTAYWYTKALTPSSGDTYYFHPGTIVPLENYIRLTVRVDYGKEKNGAKSLTQTFLINFVDRKYYPLPEKPVDFNDLKNRPFFSDAFADGIAIHPGSDMGDFLLQVLEYCRQNYLIVSVPFAQSIPRLIHFPAPDRDAFFSPDSIVVRDGCLWVVAVYRAKKAYFTSLKVLRLRDMKTNYAGIRIYDLAGKEAPGTYATGLQGWAWEAIRPGSIEESLFNAVFAYCRENGISLDP